MTWMLGLKPYFFPVISVRLFFSTRCIIGLAGRTNKYHFERSGTLPGGVSQRDGANIGDLTKFYAMDYETVSNTHEETFQNVVTLQPFSYFLRAFVPDQTYPVISESLYLCVSVRNAFVLPSTGLHYRVRCLPICMMMMMISGAYLFAVRTSICLQPIAEHELLSPGCDLGDNA